MENLIVKKFLKKFLSIILLVIKRVKFILKPSIIFPKFSVKNFTTTFFHLVTLFSFLLPFSRNYITNFKIDNYIANFWFTSYV